MIPRWFRSKCKAILGYDPTIELCHDLRIFDHVDSFGNAVVTEPYIEFDEAERKGLEFADRIGCSVIVSEQGQWHPRSCRIIFFP
jgi:hypothetical protein